MQREITREGKLLNNDGTPAVIGWSRHPYLEANLENASFYRFRPFQFLRLKQWDYYGFTTPDIYFSATLANLGYAGNAFVYLVDFKNKTVIEDSLVTPLGRGIKPPLNSTSGDFVLRHRKARLEFRVEETGRRLIVDYPSFHGGEGIRADIFLQFSPGHESMNLVIPIGKKRFYYNRKVNCLPAEGSIVKGKEKIDLHPGSCLGNLDWGRGVWEYRSFWNWASASGFLADGRSLGLNLGEGFGDTNRATEDCIILDGRVHKLERVSFQYDSHNYMRPWHFKTADGRLDLRFDPLVERIARTNLGIIKSEVHQIFGYYSGLLITDEQEKIMVDRLIGFAEEHSARW